MARGTPTAWARLADRPESAVSPIPVNAVESFSPAAATRRSQAIANPNPAPTHGPLIAATVGNGRSARPVHDRVVVLDDRVERRPGVGRERLGVLAEVLAHAERLARAGEHGRPHVVGVGQQRERRAQRRLQLDGQRVVARGPVEREHDDGGVVGVAGEQDGRLVGHTPAA